MSVGSAFGELGRTKAKKKSSEIPAVAQNRWDVGIAQTNRFREIVKNKRPVTSPKNR